jgi:hypothetical protein
MKEAKCRAKFIYEREAELKLQVVLQCVQCITSMQTTRDSPSAAFGCEHVVKYLVHAKSNEGIRSYGDNDTQFIEEISTNCLEGGCQIQG